VWANLRRAYKNDGSLQISFAQKQSDAITASYNPGEGTFYKNHTRYFDRYSLQEIPGKTLYNKPFEEGSGADKLVRMNFDIHVGAIGGIAGKCIAFLISLISGSLPITGFIVWWGKKRKGKGTRIKTQGTRVDKVEVLV
jgi:uncharacterized iron-regulated membrane protein